MNANFLDIRGIGVSEVYSVGIDSDYLKKRLQKRVIYIESLRRRLTFINCEGGLSVDRVTNSVLCHTLVSGVVSAGSHRLYAQKTGAPLYHTTQITIKPYTSTIHTCSFIPNIYNINTAIKVNLKFVSRID